MFERYRIGNAQIIGQREVQSNYFSTSYNESGGLLAVLADGSIDHPNGRRAAILAVEHCANSFIWHLPGEHTTQFLYETALQANRLIQDTVYMDKSPRLSLSMALFAGRELYYFSVGANRIYLYNGQNERILHGSAGIPYSSGKCDLNPKNIIGIFSIGAYIDAHPMERIKLTGSRKKIYDKAQNIVESISRKGLINQMNATALLVEVVR